MLNRHTEFDYNYLYLEQTSNNILITNFMFKISLFTHWKMSRPMVKERGDGVKVMFTAPSP